MLLDAPTTMDTSSPPLECFPVSESVHMLSFSPFEWSQELLAAGKGMQIAVYSFKLKDEESLRGGIQLDLVKTFKSQSRVHALAWSPEASLSVVPRCLKLGCAGADHVVVVVNCALDEDASKVLLKGHTDYVNAMAFDPDEGDHLATVSDDHTCHMWDVRDGKLEAQIHLTSPGMSVCWHREEPGKLLVAEKCGVVRLFNSTTHSPIMSLDCGKAPLMAADWSPLNPLLVAAVAQGGLFLWDLSRPSVPVSTKHIDEAGLGEVRFHPRNERIVAASSVTRRRINVVHMDSGRHLLTAFSPPLVRGISWHFRLPYFAAASDRKICFWRVSPH